MDPYLNDCKIIITSFVNTNHKIGVPYNKANQDDFRLPLVIGVPQNWLSYNKFVIRSFVRTNLRWVFAKPLILILWIGLLYLESDGSKF